jgi:C4-dicarboxylate-specific signal transduction histidine kinase
VRTAYDEYKKDFTGRTAEKSFAAVEDREAHITEQQEKARSSLQTLLQRNDDLTERVADTKRQVSSLRGGPNGASQITSIVKELSEIEGGLQDVRKKVEIAELATQSGFSVAGDLALSHTQLEDRNLRLLDAAAVGLSARSLVHEINTHLHQLGRAITAIAAANRGESRPNERIARALSSISDVIRELKKTVASIDPLAPGSRTLKENFDVLKALAEFARQRSGRLEAAKVKFELSGTPGLRIRFSSARFTQILENLLQNSLYWINEHLEELGSAARIIHVEVDASGFSWSDGAKGVRPAVEDSLLEAYVTDKPLSKGQGLGLFIVSSFLQAERCSISLLHERNPFKRRYVFRVDLSGARRG